MVKGGYAQKGTTEGEEPPPPFRLLRKHGAGPPCFCVDMKAAHRCTIRVMGGNSRLAINIPPPLVIATPLSKLLRA